jgi:hypothetical protein
MTYRENLMNPRKVIQIVLTFSVLLLVLAIWMLFIPLSTAAEDAVHSSSRYVVIEPAFQTGYPNLSGAYAGTVAISEPVTLGVLDLAFNLTDSGGILTGAIDPSQTLVFSGAPALSGNITGSIKGITPTFTINSAVFTGTVSGREVRRRITLEGEVWANGEALQGTYTEVTIGYTPESLTTRGIFIVTRAAQSSEVVAQPSLLLQVSPSSLPPDSNASVSATLLDGSLQPIANAQVTFSSDKGSFSPATVTTNAAGVASTTFTAGVVPGLGTITASGGGAVATRSIAVTSGSLTLEAGATQLTFGAQTVLTATLRDLSSNPVPGQVISFTGTLGSVFPISGTTNAGGQLATTFTAGSIPGEGKVTAETELIAASKTIIIREQTVPNDVYLPLIIKD